MISNSCIKIKTNKFPILEGEDEEIINENMYGKALCLYLEKELPKMEMQVTFYCAEDWGWWVEVKNKDFGMGLCIYSNPEEKGNPECFAILPSVQEEKKWSWSKFKKIDISHDVLEIVEKVEALFKKDGEIINVSRHDDFPF